MLLVIGGLRYSRDSLCFEEEKLACILRQQSASPGLTSSIVLPLNGYFQKPDSIAILEGKNTI